MTVKEKRLLFIRHHCAEKNSVNYEAGKYYNLAAEQADELIAAGIAAASGEIISAAPVEIAPAKEEKQDEDQA